MMTCRIVYLIAAVAALTVLAAAQGAKPASSSANSGSDPLTASTKALTPKSAMPSHRKGTVSAPTPPTRNSTTAELTRLERQNSKAGAAKSGSPTPAKGMIAKPASTSVRSGSGIDFKYQKPVGQKPATPGAGNVPVTSETSKQN